MTLPIIEIKHLTFDYPGFRSLSDINLSIAPGTVTALVGPNGAGKTTLMRCIAALETPLMGSVYVNQLDVHADPRQAHRLMGYLSDNFGLYGDLTVAQGLGYAASAQGVASDAVANAVQKTAKQLGLGDKLKHRANTLSRGQRQRLGIGQAIIHNPKVLLLDEPASGLDPEARSSLSGVFSALQAQGMSLLVSSHILAELDEYSTHMLALNEGKILEHRVLRSAKISADDPLDQRLLRFEFAQNTEAAHAWLSAQDRVMVYRTDHRGIDISFTGSLADQAHLLQACIAANPALTTVAPMSENLQQSYLKSLDAARATATRSAP
jgi:ABC-2 type transport system ATP-binding protein